MNHIVPKEHVRAAEKLRDYLSTYINSEDLINIGAYKKGSSKEIDTAIQLYPTIISYLKQATDEKFSMEESFHSLVSLIGTGD